MKLTHRGIFLFRKIFLIVGFLISLFYIQSCQSKASSVVSASSFLTGVAAAGLIRNSAVTIFSLSSDGKRLKALATTITNSDGSFSIPESLVSQAVEIVISGGSYEEESGGNTIDLHNRELRTRLSSFVSGQKIGISPLTEIAAARSEKLLSDGATLADSISTANTNLAQVTGLSDITVPPIFPKDAVANGVGLNSNQVKYALVLAGISHFSNGTLPDSLSAMAGFSSDFAKDGKFDGLDNGNAVAFGNSSVPVASDSWTTGVANAIVTFAASAEGIAAGFSGVTPSTLSGAPSTCASGLTLCGSDCVNLSTNTSHCGACGVLCTGFANTTTTSCSGGVCSITGCTANHMDCDGLSNNGCETNGNTDVNNCGACGITCSGFANTTSATCTSGNCAITGCTANHMDCDGLSNNGCETNGSTDVNNCGACGITCSGFANTTSATCSSGNCSITGCSAGYMDCDGLPYNGCETNGNTDVNNCGTCGNGCADGQTCTGGNCS